MVVQAINSLKSENENLRKELRMSKSSAIASRIAAIKKQWDDGLDQVAAKLDDIEPKVPATLGMAHTTLSQHNADIDQLESEMRQLSNGGPLESGS